MKKLETNNMKNPKISRALFIKTLTAIKEQYNHDEKCANKLKEVYPEMNDKPYYDNHYLGNAIAELLTVIMDDKTDMIGYCLWELDFFKKYKPGCVKEKGKNVNVSNPGKLYDYLAK